MMVQMIICLHEYVALTELCTFAQKPRIARAPELVRQLFRPW